MLSIDDIKLTPENGHLPNLPTWQVIWASNTALGSDLAGNTDVRLRIPASF